MPPENKLRKLAVLLEASDAPAEDVALIADLLGIPAGEAYPPLNLSPQGRKQKTFEALAGRVVALARQEPLLLLAEDVHWADPSSLELLDRIVEQLSDLPVLLIVAFRPEFAPPWVGRANATLITLSRLGRRDAEQLATEVMIGHALPPALLDRIVARSDGVPLFIEELAKSVMESGADNPTVLPSLAVPESLQALLTARLDRLPAAKRVAQIGATIGRDFSQSLLAAVGRLPRTQLAVGLDELVGSGLASRRRELADTSLHVQACAGAGGHLRQRAAQAAVRDSCPDRGGGGERCIAGRDRARPARISLCSGRSAGEGRVLLPDCRRPLGPTRRGGGDQNLPGARAARLPKISRRDLIATIWKRNC